MAGQITRIFSDIHFGDRASRVSHLRQLQPLLADIDHLVLNGDTLDTRTGPFPDHTAACRAEVDAFARTAAAPITFLTGNHDPDLSPHHSLELADGQVFVVHGDVLFDDIVPWGRDARLIRQRIADTLGAGSAPARLALEERLRIWRVVAASIPQRHQSERDWLKYAVRFAVDTVWPPLRFFRILEAWRQEPVLAATLLRQQRPRARFLLLGHTHRPAIRQLPGGLVIINTGSFTAPFGGYAVDLAPGTLRVRRVIPRGTAFHPGPTLAEFPLANG
ncbi:metallophosphoesterase [Opitutus sp. ER46]|uniref:metallophosphoesterase n=1 Tax=Opitutus sp. ER46 TaxID=2161864 RepID=UPI00130480B7|nr:metallophosphoesterase [Opitutus sp. ER46]